MICKFFIFYNYDKLRDNEVMSVIKNIPSTSKRRINQCLALAQKLKTTTMENGKLINDLNELKEINKKNLEEKEVLREIVDRMNQP